MSNTIGQPLMPRHFEDTACKCTLLHGDAARTPFKVLITMVTKFRKTTEKHPPGIDSDRRRAIIHDFVVRYRRAIATASTRL